MPLPAWLNPSKVVKAIQLANQLELLEKLHAEKQLSARLLETQEADRAEIASLRATIEGMRALAAEKASVVFEQNAAWIGEGESRKGPFCQTCCSKDDKLIPLSIVQQADGGKKMGLCGSCKNRVWIVAPNDAPHAMVQRPRMYSDYSINP